MNSFPSDGHWHFYSGCKCLQRCQTLGVISNDALSANESAVRAMGDDKLRVIAAELVTKVGSSVTIDWTLRESARAGSKAQVKRILNKFGYPPDLQDAAVQTVLLQAETLCKDWAA